MDRKRIRRKVQSYLMITLASLAYAAGISLFLDPNDLAPGGITGIAILIGRLTGAGTGMLILLLNIPLLILGVWKLAGSLFFPHFMPYSPFP